jgi:hypothetical protein
VQALHHSEGAWSRLLEGLRGDPRQVFAVGPLGPPASEWEFFPGVVKGVAAAAGLELCVGLPQLLPSACAQLGGGKGRTRPTEPTAAVI